jgi:dTDP-4-amino-4,6-dideoxygalactose transaminase
MPAHSSGADEVAQEFVLVGMSGGIGRDLIGLLCDADARVTVVDAEAPHPDCADRVRWIACDLLSEDVELPPGRVVLLLGGDDAPRWPWRAALEASVPTARLLPALAGRSVVLPRWAGNAEPPSAEANDIALGEWCARLTALTANPVDPSSVAALCRELVAPSPEPGARIDPQAAMSRARAAQLLLLRTDCRLGDLTIVTPSVTGAGAKETEHDWAGELARLLLASEPSPAPGRESRAAHQPLFHPAIPVVIPPRPARPDVVARRQQQAMWSGRLKAGNAWGMRLRQQLRERLRLEPGYELLLTTSGTAALELAIVAAAGAATPGAVALVPSFTYRATVDVLLRLGYGIRYVDVNPFSWTLDPAAMATALDDDRVRLAVCVDTFGNPCAYEVLGPLCAARGVPLVADSAAGFGSSYRGHPVGQQAAAHAFSMSFAKVLTAAGAGGTVTFRRDQSRVDLSSWAGSQLMNEMHAIAALDQLAVLDEMVSVRNEIAEAYSSVLQGFSGVATQQVANGDVHSYVHWVARVPDREALAARLAELGVLTKPYFPAQHQHHPVAITSDRLRVTEQLDAQALALPTSSELSRRQVQRLQHALHIALSDLASRAPRSRGEEARDA